MADLSTTYAAPYALMKAAMGRTTVSEEIENLMLAKIDQANSALARAGIVIDTGVPSDNSLLAAYAEWIYNRRNSEDPKPRSLIEEIHSRQIAKSTASADEGAG